MAALICAYGSVGGGQPPSRTISVHIRCGVECRMWSATLPARTLYMRVGCQTLAWSNHPWVVIGRPHLRPVRTPSPGNAPVLSRGPESSNVAAAAWSAARVLTAVGPLNFRQPRRRGHPFPPVLAPNPFHRRGTRYSTDRDGRGSGTGPTMAPATRCSGPGPVPGDRRRCHRPAPDPCRDDRDPVQRRVHPQFGERAHELAQNRQSRRAQMTPLRRMKHP